MSTSGKDGLAKPRVRPRRRTVKNRNVTNAHLGMLLWALIVGASFPIVGLLSEGLPPLLLTAMRFAIAALAMLPMIWRSGPAAPSPRAMLLYSVMGLCLAGFFGVMFWAAHRVSALSMAALFVSMPLLAYSLGRVFGVEARARRLLAILALGAAGALALALAQSGGDLAQLEFGWSEAAFFLGCVASALYPVLSKWGLARGILSPDAAVRTFWSLALGGVLIALAGFAAEPVAAMPGMNFRDVLLVAYLGVFSSGATFWLMQRATGALTPGAVTAYSYLVPFVSMLVLFVTRPDLIGWHWLPGSVLVITAITLLFRGGAGRPAVSARRDESTSQARLR
jgi:drug/metabolite transporter (DMT)-like permease